MARHTTSRRHLAPNDIVFHTASGGLLVAAGPPASTRPRWGRGLSALLRRRSALPR